MALGGGGQLTQRQHLLSRDGRLLLCSNAERIRVYSAITAELLFALHGHTDQVTSLCLHPKISTQVYSSSLDGTLALWDLEDGTQIKSWNAIGEPIESFTIIESTAFITCQWREAQAGRALAIDLASGTVFENRIKLSTPNTIVSSAQGNLIATHDRHTILIFTPSTFGTAPPLAIHHTKAITCISLSPDGSRIAAGDVTGRIIVWHDIIDALEKRLNNNNNNNNTVEKTHLNETDTHHNEQEDDEEEPVYIHREPPQATVHWHAHAVGCLTFSNDGIYLLSGGKEAVLVMWDVISGRRAYLPRLGGHLIGIAPCTKDASKYAVRQRDNTLRIVNMASMTVECSIHGVRPLPPNIMKTLLLQHASSSPSLTFERNDGGSSGVSPSLQGRSNNDNNNSSSKKYGGIVEPPPLLIQPLTGHAVIPGSNVVLQFYDIYRDIQADKLQISHRSIVSLTETDTRRAMGGVYGAPAEPAVEFFQFNKDGSVVATVESRPDVAGGDMVQYMLKFWSRNSEENATYGAPYSLNTVADQPHRSSAGFGNITSLSFHPKQNKVVTTSDCGEFKTWIQQSVRISQSKKDEKERENIETWRCISVGEYKNQPLSASAFSSDGSLLAIGSFDGSITLWDAEKTLLLHVLPPVYAAAASISSSISTFQQQQQLPIKSLHFITQSSLLIAVLTNALAVYDVIRLQCIWSIGIDIGMVAIDPGSMHWAITVPGGGASSPYTTTTTTTTPPKGGSKQARSGVHGIVMFHAGKESPVAAWNVHRSHVASTPLSCTNIVFIPPSLARINSVAAQHLERKTDHKNNNSNDTDDHERGAVPGSSPLLVVTGEREYSIANIASTMDGSAQKTIHPYENIAGTDAVYQQRRGINSSTKTAAAMPSYQSLYGKSATDNSGQNSGGDVMAHDAVNVGMTKKALAALFDAPSHALPAMGTLCPAFLELMVVGVDEIDEE